jgi:hypothetical protein
VDEAVSRREQVRAEAHFALQFGAAVLVLGVTLALILGALALPPAPKLAPLHAALIAAPLVLLGWGVCAYASWRLELLQRLAREPGLVLGDARAARSKIETMRRFFRQRRMPAPLRQSRRQRVQGVRASKA